MKSILFFGLTSVILIIAAPITSAAEAAPTPDKTEALRQVFDNSPGWLAATGKVVGPTSSPQPGVPIQIQGPLGTTRVYTDSSGRWSLYKLPAGNYQATPVTGPTKEATVNFTVKPTGWWQTIFGSAGEAAVAPQIKLSTPYKY